MSLALEFLRDGPDVPGAKQREDIAPAIHVLHIARSGRKGRHFLVFRVAGDSLLDVLRVYCTTAWIYRGILGNDTEAMTTSEVSGYYHFDLSNPATLFAAQTFPIQGLTTAGVLP
ncbi:hypothetical protein LDB30_13855 [Acidithiobacillus ferrooxidans]|nr:hypothetical protein LDB30_13855 [Acidithiobacillus ferrooxidans]